MVGTLPPPRDCTGQHWSQTRDCCRTRGRSTSRYHGLFTQNLKNFDKKSQERTLFRQFTYLYYASFDLSSLPVVVQYSSLLTLRPLLLGLRSFFHLSFPVRFIFRLNKVGNPLVADRNVSDTFKNLQIAVETFCAYLWYDILLTD